jgi:hypothetical protein
MCLVPFSSHYSLMLSGERGLLTASIWYGPSALSASEIAVRRYGGGFVIGLLTPERRSARGRRWATRDE